MTGEFIILGLVLVAIASIFLSTLLTGASPLPTSSVVRETMLATLPQEVDGPVYELGSGWGGLAAALARRYPKTPVRAYEVSLLPWAAAKLRQQVQGPENLAVRFGDFHKADLSDAALVVCYLPGTAMEKLKPKLVAELKPGALVASNTFAIREWKAEIEKTASDIHNSRVYLYRIS